MGAPIEATVANFKKGAADIVEGSQPELDDVFEFFSSGQFSKGQRAHSVLLRSHLEEFDPVFDRWRLPRPRTGQSGVLADPIRHLYCLSFQRSIWITRRKSHFLYVLF